MRRFLLCALLVAAMIALPLYGAGKAETKAVSLTWWLPNPELEPAKNAGVSGVLKAFTDANPGATVTIEIVPYTEMQKKLLTAIAAGTGPQIYTIPDEWLGLLMSNGIVEPVPVADEQAFFASGVWPKLADCLKRDGRLQGYPHEISIYGLFYNKDMFKEAGLDPEKPPKTWDEFRDYAKKLTKTDPAKGTITRVGYAIRHLGTPGGVVGKWISFLWSTGTDLVENPYTSNGKKATFNTPGGLAAVQLYYDMIYTDKSTSLDFPDPRNAFAQKIAAMQISENGIWATMLPADLNWGFAPIPKPAVGGVDATVFSEWAHYVTKSASDIQKQTAFKLLRFWCNQDSDPVVRSVYPGWIGDRKATMQADPFYKARPALLEALAAVMPTGRAYSHNLKLSQINDIVGLYIAKVWHKEMSAKEALDKAEAEVNAALQAQ
jgi:multiple sugar transport system substrate-binding protein